MSDTGLFDDLLDTTPASTETNTENAVEATSEATPTASEAKDEPTRDTVIVESLENLPEGLVEVKEFAWLLTKRNMDEAVAKGRTPSRDDMVDTQAVYASTRGKRWSLPALEAVTADGTKLGLVIPTTEGLAAWDARPERGTGSGGAAMTPERRAVRILRAGKAADRLKYWERRVARYTTLLAEVGATWDDANAAYDAWAESEEAKKEIKDKDETENGEE